MNLRAYAENAQQDGEGEARVGFGYMRRINDVTVVVREDEKLDRLVFVFERAAREKPSTRK